MPTQASGCGAVYRGLVLTVPAEAGRPNDAANDETGFVDGQSDAAFVPALAGKGGEHALRAVPNQPVSIASRRCVQMPTGCTSG